MIKALGTESRYPLTLLSISVLTDEHGHPQFYFSRTLQALLKLHDLGSSHFSNTNENDLNYAILAMESLE